MKYAYDCAFSFPGPNAAAKLGYEVCIRYLAHRSSQTAAKIWTPQQIDLVHGAGMAAGAVFEQEAADPLKGYQEGVTHCQIAEAEWDALGAPDGTVIGYAYDFDPNPQQVVAYAEGVRATASGRFPLMGYCSDAVAVEFFKRDLIDYFWQTESQGFQGRWPSPIAHLIQHTWYDLRPKMPNDYDENVLHPENGQVPWWDVHTEKQEEVYMTTVLAGSTEVIALTGAPGQVILAADSPSMVRHTHGTVGTPTYISKGDVEPVGHYAVVAHPFAAGTKLATVHVYAAGEKLPSGQDSGGTGAPVGVTVVYD